MEGADDTAQSGGVRNRLLMAEPVEARRCCADAEVIAGVTAAAGGGAADKVLTGETAETAGG